MPQKLRAFVLSAPIKKADGAGFFHVEAVSLEDAKERIRNATHYLVEDQIDSVEYDFDDLQLEEEGK